MTKFLALAIAWLDQRTRMLDQVVRDRPGPSISGVLDPKIVHSPALPYRMLWSIHPKKNEYLLIAPALALYSENTKYESNIKKIKQPLAPGPIP